MNRLWISLAFATTFTPFVDAQVRQFPYEARVVVDEVYVRSAGGEKYYPTMTLPRDAKVTVRRHDPGGWYKIEPPQGSFSWVLAKYVQETGGGAGEIIENNTVVFVGSAFGDETSIWQRKLMAGEKVKVLGQKEVLTAAGPSLMTKIEPPSREWRWIPGTAIVPIGESVRAEHDSNPYVVPSHIAEQMAQTPAVQPEATAKAEPQNTSRFAPSQQLAQLQKIREEQRELRQIDQRFRSMILADPSQWDLDAIEKSYLELQNSATFKPVVGQIDLRYPAISRYRQRKAQIEDLNRLTSATEKRDADLLATQFGFPTSAMGPESMQQHFPVEQPFQSSEMVFPTPGANFPGLPAAPSVASVSASSGVLALPSTGGYSGAGLVQRGAENTDSPYLLTSPDGKLLAHLKPESGVDLEQYVGRSVGLHGKRWFDDSINSDRIQVTGLSEVQLRN